MSQDTRPCPNPSASNPSEEPDAVLLSRWLEGEERGGRTLFRRHYGGLTRYFARTTSIQDQHELAQETLEQVCRSAALARGEVDQFRNYLYGIARNVRAHYLRSTYRRREFESSLDRSEELAEFDNPATLLAEVQARANLVDLLGLLSPDKRALLQAYYWEGETAEQLGHSLGIPAGTVRTRIHANRRKLQAWFEDRGDQWREDDVRTQAERLLDLLCSGPEPGQGDN